MKAFVLAALAACLSAYAAPAAAQSVSGCGTTAIAKADQNNAAKLGTAADCFGKVKSIAAAAEAARRERIVAITPKPVPTPTPTPAPVFWINCAAEGQVCNAQPGVQVRYGAGTSFKYKVATGPIGCTNAVFGDPAVGVTKACAYASTKPAPAAEPGTGDVVKPETADSVTAIPASIPSNFDVASMLVPAWGHGNVPVSAKPDVVGAFRFICTPAHISYDDPVVFPGQAGKSHLHQWFGNTAANANSTYASLRMTGDSTCMNPLNRSAYWMPAMLDGKGNVVRPDYISVYYKRRPKSDPECLRMALKGCVNIPRGLRYVFGYDMVTSKTPTGGGYFNCDGAGAVNGHFATITEAAKGCPAGARLGAVVNAPECWDGKRLDSPNHRDHMATPGYGSWGYLKCPDTHPYVIPAFTMGAWYTVDAARADDWYLSSDEMAGMPRMPAGSTLHADWFGAWDDGVLERAEAACIDKLLNCSGGDLGDGSQLRQAAPFSWYASPRLVPVPDRPVVK